MRNLTFKPRFSNIKIYLFDYQIIMVVFVVSFNISTPLIIRVLISCIFKHNALILNILSLCAQIWQKQVQIYSTIL